MCVCVCGVCVCVWCVCVCDVWCMCLCVCVMCGVCMVWFVCVSGVYVFGVCVCVCVCACVSPRHSSSQSLYVSPNYRPQPPLNLSDACPHLTLPRATTGTPRCLIRTQRSPCRTTAMTKQITCWLSSAAVGTAWSLPGSPRNGQAPSHLFQNHGLC